jgi:hypothetical protein
MTNVGVVQLNRAARQVLGHGRIGMLALKASRLPLVNPAAFSFTSGSIWMTTSRYAAKNLMAKRDPRAAFLVDGGSQAVLVRGTIEVFDPLNISNQVRAALAGPGLYMGMAGYAMRNVPFVAGYLLDLARIPREWLPYNRTVLQLHATDVEVMDVAPFPAAQAARVPGVPAEVSRKLAGVGRGYACWYEGRVPVIRPALWEVEHGEVVVAPAGGRPRAGAVGALVVESHHRFRPSLMVGACVRGTFGGEAGPSMIAERYGLDEADVPHSFEFRPERVTSWRGFSITTSIPRSARRLRIAEG